MLGYPLKVILNAIEKDHGREGVLRTLEDAGIPVDRTYRLNESYDDDEARRLSAAAFKRISLEEMAQVFFDDTLARFPKWFEICKTSRDFLEMQPEIHNTFAIGMERPQDRDAVIAKFRLEKLEDELVVRYRSSNQMCDMYKAIAQRVFQHFGDTATIDEDRCMQRGDSECVLRIRWS